jgi:hypothetical protein
MRASTSSTTNTISSAIITPHTFSPPSRHHDATQHASMHLRRVYSPNDLEGEFSEVPKIMELGT